MAIESVKIPQNVYIEDRIIGPITLKQIMIVLGGGSISYVMYTSLMKAMGGSLGILPTVIVWIPCAIAVAFAFIRINDLSLLKICLLTLEKINNPTTRMWTPRRGLTIHIRTTTQELEKTEKEKREAELAAMKAKHTEKKIQELSTVLDQPLPVSEGETESLTEPPPAAAAPAHAEPPHDEPAEPQPTLPVDPNRIRTDDDHGGLSAFEGVFRDISPNP
jgi:hypothetical protein